MFFLTVDGRQAALISVDCDVGLHEINASPWLWSEQLGK